MKGRRFAPWILVLSLVSCGFDGGSSGTGITGGTSGTGISSGIEDLESGVSTIEGNVSSLAGARRSVTAASPTLLAELKKLVEISPTAIAAGTVGDIRVWIEGTAAEGMTDDNGFFSLSGSFGERVSIVFERASGERARLGAVVPSGGVLQLEGVFVNFGDGSARVERQTVRFAGVVRDIDCVNQRVTATSRFDPNGLEYVVHMAGAQLSSDDGQAVHCWDLAPGDRIAVNGQIQPDGSIGSAQTRQTMTSLGL